MTNEELMALLNREPLPEMLLYNNDGYAYIPISTIQTELNNIFGMFSWSTDREGFVKSGIYVSGKLFLTHPVTNAHLFYSGTAGVSGVTNIKLDYPSVESHCFLNAAKKIGKWFGRDLNRDKENEILNGTQSVQVKGETEEHRRVKLFIDMATTKSDLIKLSRDVPKELIEYYTDKLKKYL